VLVLGCSTACSTRLACTEALHLKHASMQRHAVRLVYTDTAYTHAHAAREYMRCSVPVTNRTASVRPLDAAFRAMHPHNCRIQASTVHQPLFDNPCCLQLTRPTRDHSGRTYTSPLLSVVRSRAKKHARRYAGAATSAPLSKTAASPGDRALAGGRTQLWRSHTTRPRSFQTVEARVTGRPRNKAASPRRSTRAVARRPRHKFWGFLALPSMQARLARR